MTDPIAARGAQPGTEARHRHFSLDTPPYFCEVCGKRWTLVVDGREGRRRRRDRANRKPSDYHIGPCMYVCGTCGEPLAEAHRQGREAVLPPYPESRNRDYRTEYPAAVQEVADFAEGDHHVEGCMADQEEDADACTCALRWVICKALVEWSADHRTDRGRFETALQAIVTGAPDIQGECRWCHGDLVDDGHTDICPAEVARGAISHRPSDD